MYKQNIIFNSQKVETTKYLSNDEWKNKMWNTHNTIEHYSSIKRNEVLLSTTTWMDPVMIMLILC